MERLTRARVDPVSTSTSRPRGDIEARSDRDRHGSSWSTGSREGLAERDSTDKLIVSAHGTGTTSATTPRSRPTRTGARGAPLDRDLPETRCRDPRARQIPRRAASTWRRSCGVVRSRSARSARGCPACAPGQPDGLPVCCWPRATALLHIDVKKLGRSRRGDTLFAAGCGSRGRRPAATTPRAMVDMSRSPTAPFADARGTTCARFRLDAAAIFAGHGSGWSRRRDDGRPPVRLRRRLLVAATGAVRRMAVPTLAASALERSPVRRRTAEHREPEALVQAEGAGRVLGIDAEHGLVHPGLS